MDQLSLKKVKIRKPHKCWGCAKEFEVGTLMTYAVTADQGDFVSAYWCSECENILNSLEAWQLEDGFAFGELVEYIND